MLGHLTLVTSCLLPSSHMYCGSSHTWMSYPESATADLLLASEASATAFLMISHVWVSYSGQDQPASYLCCSVVGPCVPGHPTYSMSTLVHVLFLPPLLIELCCCLKISQRWWRGAVFQSVLFLLGPYCSTDDDQEALNCCTSPLLYFSPLYFFLILY